MGILITIVVVAVIMIISSIAHESDMKRQYEKEGTCGWIFKITKPQC